MNNYRMYAGVSVAQRKVRVFSVLGIFALTTFILINFQNCAAPLSEDAFSELSSSSLSNSRLSSVSTAYVDGSTLYFLTKDGSYYEFDLTYRGWRSLNAKPLPLPMANLWRNDSLAPRNPAAISASFTDEANVVFLDADQNFYVYSIDQKKFISRGELADEWGDMEFAPGVDEHFTTAFNFHGKLMILTDSKWYLYNWDTERFEDPAAAMPELGGSNDLADLWGTVSFAPHKFEQITASFSIGDFIYMMDINRLYAYRISTREWVRVVHMQTDIRESFCKLNSNSECLLR